MTQDVDESRIVKATLVPNVSQGWMNAGPYWIEADENGVAKQLAARLGAELGFSPDEIVVRELRPGSAGEIEIVGVRAYKWDLS